jgi:hypothetical protein
MSDLISETPIAAAERLATALRVRLDLLRELHHLHLRQWQLEDETRGLEPRPQWIAAAKREIDACNLRRHRIINAIDASVTTARSGQVPRYYSETVGELCDRLLILDLKRRAVVEPCVRDGSGGARRDDSGDADSLDRACQHLAAVVTHLIDDLAAGRAALPPRVGMKVYNGAVQ